MPQWSVAEWRARIGGSWLANGRPIKSKSSSSSGRPRCMRRVLTINHVVTMMSLTIIMLGANLVLHALVNRGCLWPIFDLLEFGILSHSNLHWINSDYLLLTVGTLLSLHEFFLSTIIMCLRRFACSLKQGLCPTSWLLESIKGPLLCPLLLLANFVVGPKSNVVKEELELRDRGELLRRLAALSNVLLDIVLSVAVYVIIYKLLKSGDVEKNPGPGNLDYNSVDASKTLDKGDLSDVMEEVISIQSRFYDLGRSLRLEVRDLKAIRDAYPKKADAIRALEDVLLLWLDQKYDADKYGRPTWHMLVTAVDKETGGNDHELAKKIADQHPAEHQSRCQNPMEAIEQTDKELLGVDNVREVLDVLWKYRAKWRFIGLELQIESSDLDAIGVNCRMVEDALLEMINLWLRRANPKPTRTVLKTVTQSKLLNTKAETKDLVIEAETQSITSTQEDSASAAQGCWTRCCVALIRRLAIDRRITAREANPLIMEAQPHSEHLVAKADSTQKGHVQETPELYALYLKSLYKAQSLAGASVNEWPPPCTDKVVRLAMIERGGKDVGDDAVLREKTISGRVDDVLQRMVPVEIKDIFKVKDQQKMLMEGAPGKVKDRQKKVKKVLMEGAPGSGKSTLSFHVCRQWMEGHVFQEYKLVIIVRLRESAIQNATNLIEILPRRSETMGIEIADIITASDGKDVLFILDGWDELPRNVPAYSLILDLVKGSKLPETSIIITSRPTSSAILHRLVHLQIEILGFTKNELHQYFMKCLENSAKAVQRLLQRIEQNPIIEGSCYLPLNASILVHLFKCRHNMLPTTQYGIFTDLVCTCIFRHLKKTHQDVAELRSLDELPRSTAVQFRHLCKIAYDGVMRDKVIFDLGPNFDTLGLLQGVESFAVCGKSYSYNFLHLSIQELLCALHMANELDESEQTEQFNKLFGKARFMLVFQFFAAKTKLKTSGISEVVTQVAKQYSDSGPCYADSTLFVSLMHCLFEAQDSSLCQLVAIELKHKLTFKDVYIHFSPTDCYYLCYFLTFCDDFDVNFTLCYIGANHCKSLFRSGEVYTFRSLDLSRNPIGTEGAMALAAAIETATNLRKLVLCSIGKEGAMAFAAAMKTARYTNLQELDLSGNPIGREGAMALAAAMETATNLRKLVLCSIGKEGVMAFAAAMKTATNLQELDLGSNFIGDEGAMAVVAAIKIATNLQKLNLNSNSIGSKGAMALAAAVETATNLRNLVLTRNSIGSKGVMALAAAIKTATCTNIQALYLNENSIGREGAMALAAAMERATNLRVLILNTNSIGNEGATAFATAMETASNLLSLDLGHNSIGREGATALAAAIKATTNLQSLSLGNNSIGNEGAMALATAMETAINLQELILDDNCIGKEGAMALATAMETAINLRALILTLNSIGREGEDAIRAAAKKNGTKIYF